MSFDKLRKNQKNALQSLQKQVKESNDSKSGGAKDEREWRHTYDKTTKIGTSIIRFLPWGDNARLPYAEWYEYSFRTPAGNYWDRSRTTIGEDDPVAKLNTIQWNRNLAGDQDAVKKRGRKTRFIANIVVVSDSAHPENNGKVFLYKFGKAIHDIVMAKLVPKYEDQSPLDVFSLWEGANFSIRTKEKSSFVNYDDSSFAESKQLHPNEDLMRKWYDSMFDLTEFEDTKLYKSYEVLDKEMRKVLGERVVAGILDEKFNPAQSDNTGNSFQQEKQNEVDPFKTSKPEETKQPEKEVDPFADAKTSEEDPFKNQSETKQPEKEVDPFADAKQEEPNKTSDDDDPFANLEL